MNDCEVLKFLKKKHKNAIHVYNHSNPFCILIQGLFNFKHISFSLDLSIFENRIKANHTKKRKLVKRWTYLTLLLVSCIVYNAYQLYLERNSIVHLWIFVILSSLLFILVASGILYSKISANFKYIQRTNRALKPFNLSIDSQCRLEFNRKIPKEFVDGYRSFKKY